MQLSKVRPEQSEAHFLFHKDIIMARPPSRTTRTAEKVRRFCAALAQGESISSAAAAAGIGRRTAYDWRRDNDEFAKAWDDAVEAGTDLLEDEARRRAYEGIDEPVYYQGNQCGVVRKYSDTLLIFALKARRPEKYRERSNVEMTGRDGGPVEIDDRAAATRIAALLAAAKARRGDGGGSDA